AARRRAPLGLRGPLARGGRATPRHPRGHGEVAPAPRAAAAAGGARAMSAHPTRPEAPAGPAARIVAAAAPEPAPPARHGRRRTRVALLVLLGAPALAAGWQFALLAARPVPAAPALDAQGLAQLVGPDGRFAAPDAARPTPVGLHGLALLALARSEGEAAPA